MAGSPPTDSQAPGLGMRETSLPYGYVDPGVEPKGFSLIEEMEKVWVTPLELEQLKEWKVRALSGQPCAPCGRPRRATKEYEERYSKGLMRFFLAVSFIAKKRRATKEAD